MDREDVLRLALDSFASDGLDAVREAAAWMAGFLSLDAPTQSAPERKKMPPWTPERRAAQADRMRRTRKEGKLASRPRPETPIAVPPAPMSKLVSSSPPPLNAPRFPSGVEVERHVVEKGVKKVQSPEQVAEYLRTKGRRVVLREGPLEKVPGKPHLPPSRRRIVLLEDREVPMSVLYDAANTVRISEGLGRLDVPE
jgi:hypothetical protein